MEEEKYMQRCIELARNGLCNVSPNPMVGAVIVHNGRIMAKDTISVADKPTQKLMPSARLKIKPY